jgi:hypothetical protein
MQTWDEVRISILTRDAVAERLGMGRNQRPLSEFDSMVRALFNLRYYSSM